MKKDIHPEYQTITATCSTCSSQFSFGTTVSKVSVDVCSGCHSFYTGDKSKTKATGRIERFNRMAAFAQKNKK
ncbi:50S ribosomal protein L31 [Mycoplasma procyoni]|uniref:50S ribosomal protein L31 n=1 Tax=Mycoplasma procyoni TaxID=568784 RepID=UPI00197BF46F|nr:50S ribosomal protein L31 [Mycoplasma procyoni]MBN3534877.1 50S ribosomal protein L31 [Mycoplasma procyoni]